MFRPCPEKRLQESSARPHVDNNKLAAYRGFEERQPCQQQATINTGHNDHGYAAPPETSVPPPTGEHQANSDHDYSSSANPKLKSIDDSKSLISDPIGFMDASFSIQDVNNAISSLSRDKARGYDDLPNECIIFSPPTFRTLLSELFNMIKQSNISHNFREY